ncbi:MAG: uL13 family ribosomal protein [Candidatus Hodgkinia cicadicola]
MKYSVYIIDLYNKSLGRIVSVISNILIRKYIYSNEKNDIKLFLININFIKKSKLFNKFYWKHTGYPGGIKFKIGNNFPIKDLLIKILSNMLPNNKIKNVLLKNVHIFNDLKSINFSKNIKYINA